MKFRGYKKDSGEMLSHLQLMSFQYPITQNRKERFDIFNYDVIDIMEQTPYQDRNGVSVYEKDILENTESKRQRFCYEVTRDKDTGNFVVVPFMKGRASISFGYGTMRTVQDLSTLMESDVVVIGNKYENPELLRRF